MEYNDKWLGTMPDATLAKLTGKCYAWIRRRRVSTGVSSYRSLFGCLPRLGYRTDVFDNLDVTSAYWLGFYCADGCVCKTTGNRHIVTVSSLDCEIIDKLKTFYEIHNHTTTTIVNNKVVYHLQLCNKKLFNRLCELGCVPRKSNVLDAPPIDDKFYLPFILGYFDGDGSISRNSTINSWRVAIGTGSKKLFEWLESIIIKLNLAYSIDVRIKKNVFYNICLCGISGKFFLKQLYDSLPDHLPLSRKKYKFAEMSMNKFRGPNLFEWEKEYIVANKDNYLCSKLIKLDKRNYGWERSPETIRKSRRHFNYA
jgi:hypothetical protein